MGFLRIILMISIFRLSLSETIMNPPNPLQQNHDENYNPQQLAQQQQLTTNQVANQWNNAMIQVVSYFHNCLQEQQTIITNYRSMLDDEKETVIELVMKDMLNQIERN